MSGKARDAEENLPLATFMFPDSFCPRLRRVEIQTYEEDGEEFFHFHDPQDIAPDAALPRAWAPILATLDGTRSVCQLVEGVAGGDPIEIRAVLETLLSELDELYYLDSPRFSARQRELESDFFAADVRPAAFAGLSYPDDADELRAFLREKLAQGEKRLPTRRYAPEKVRGIVTPHIDFGRGGHTEAASYAPLLENVRATGKAFDTLVILGIAHGGIEYPFCATPKSFATPLGTAELDAAFLRDLETEIGPQLTREELSHKQEHSIEFAAVFSQLFPELRSSKIVPILCGGFWKSLRSGQRPEDAEPEVGKFIAALRDVTRAHESRGQKIGFIASVDGSHVGTQFGDDSKITPQRLGQIESEDRVWCQAIERGDRAALHAHFAKNDNANNVDAHPALYTLMAAFPDWRGQLLDYDQAFNARANIVVSFASLALFE